MLAVMGAALVGAPSAAAFSDADPHWHIGEPLPNAAIYLDLARQAWNGQTPACGTATTYNWSGLSLDALSSIGDTAIGDCNIYWDAYNRWKATDYAWCVTVVHEYGHLLGRPHNLNRRSVMYELGPWFAHVPVCDRYRDPSGGCTAEISMHGKSYHRLCGNPRRRDELAYSAATLR